MSLEGYDVCSLVYTLLRADAGPGGVNTLLGGRIYQDRVPQAAPLPAATIALVAAPPTNTLGGVHVKSTVSVDVRVVAAGASYAPIEPIARRVDVVLHGASGTAGETYAYKLEKIDERREATDEAGASFRHLIDTYRTEAHPAT